MSSFQWHLMADEVPEYGKRNYLVMGPKGGLKIARGFCEGVGGPFGAHFHAYHNGYGFIDTDEVYAWAEIPPLEVTKRRCAECDLNLDMGTGIPFCLHWSESTEDDGFCHAFEPRSDDGYEA